MNRRILKTLTAMVLCLSMVFGSVMTTLAETTEEPEVVQGEGTSSAEEVLQALEASVPAFEPVSEPVTEPVTDPVAEPAADPVTEPAAEPVIEPVTDPAAEPATDPLTDPAAEPATDSVAEPVTEPAAEPVPEPVSEPAAKPAPTDGNKSGTANSSPTKSGKADPGPGQAGYKVTDNLADAEKYLEDGYDANLCWAATAANMLWEGNYGREAVNPLTNKNFESADEIFDYFRKCFTDEQGVPENAVEYFIEGTYSGGKGDAQLRANAPKGGLISGFTEIPKGYYEGYEQKSDNNILTALGDMVNMVVGGWLRWWNTSQKKFDESAHWLTVASYEMENNQCTGIWLVDSDNDTVLEDGQASPAGRTDKQKAELAAKQPNTRTYYPLSWQLIDKMYYWVIEGYLGEEEPVKKAVLGAVDYLKYMPLAGGGCDDEEQPQEQASTDSPGVDQSSSDRKDSEKAAVHQDIPQDAAVMASVYDSIKTMMIEKGIVCYAPMGNVYDSGSSNEHSLIIGTSFTSLLNVYVNGVRLSGNGQYYTITRTPNGMFIITFTKDYLKKLGLGEHLIKLELNGMDDINTTVIVR